jgi:hypothetical protein
MAYTAVARSFAAFGGSYAPGHSHLQASRSHLQDFHSHLQVLPSGPSNTKVHCDLNLLDTV